MLKFAQWLEEVSIQQLPGEIGPAINLTAYHGTLGNFQSFDISKLGSTTDFGTLGAGIYLSSDREVAASYARMAYKKHMPETSPRMMTVQVNLQKPFYVDARNRVLRNHFEGDAKQQSVALTNIMKANGVDAIILTPDNTEICVFDPSKIKIVDNAEMERPAVRQPRRM